MRFYQIYGIPAALVLLISAPVLAATTHMHAMTGEIRAVDAAAHTVTVASLPGKKEREMTFHLASDAKITRNKQAVPAAEVKEGERVIVQYAQEKGQHVAHAVALNPAAAEPAKLSQ
jgi:hypothetical protein